MALLLALLCAVLVAWPAHQALAAASSLLGLTNAARTAAGAGALTVAGRWYVAVEFTGEAR